LIRGKPASVLFLENLVTEADSESSWVIAMTLLESEYSWYGMKVEEEQTAREVLRRFPDEPMAYINLATCLATSLDKPDEAVDVALSGVSVSKEKGVFRRHALQTLARIAKAARRYSIVENVIKQLIDLSEYSSSQDVNMETDFLESLPKSQVNQELVSEYFRLASHK